jgi:flagellar L-ring protein FlgH
MKSQSLCLLAALVIAAALSSGVGAQQTGAKALKKETQERAETASAPEEAAATMRYAPAARAANGSLFNEAAPGLDLVGDFRPRRVGDLVFVDVIETSSATVTSNAKRNRDTGTLGGLVTAAGALPAPGAAVVAGAAGALGTRKFEGSGTTGRQSRLQARIAARVVEVLPNGDFRIEAQKVVTINKEDEKLRLDGVVRQRDISSDNAVPTTAVGDLRVQLSGKGVASADNAPGWLFRFFEKISPF